MDRDGATGLFSDYLEHRLPAEERARLEAYLATDEEAAAELEALRRTLCSLSELRAEQPPTGFPRQVERRIRVRSRGRFFSERMLTRVPFEWFSFIIIMLLLTLYMLFIIRSRETQPTIHPIQQRGAPNEGDRRGGDQPAN